jgi:hypothetical protein
MFSRKLYLILFVTLFLSKNNSLFAQSSANKSILAEAEKVLAASAFTILNGDDTEDRLRADSFFTRQLVQALRIPLLFSLWFRFFKNHFKIVCTRQ